MASKEDAFQKDFQAQTLSAMSAELIRTYGDTAAHAYRVLVQAITARTAMVISLEAGENQKVSVLFVEAMATMDQAVEAFEEQLKKLKAAQTRLLKQASDLAVPSS